MVCWRRFRCICYVDDFLVLGNSSNECRDALLCLLNLLVNLGFPVKWEEGVGPTQRITFSEVTIDSCLQRLELSQDELSSLVNMAKAFSCRQEVTMRDLQLLVGHLSFAAKTIFGARTFSCLFIDQLATLRQPSHQLRLPLLL